jgi:hypothetical protein
MTTTNESWIERYQQTKFAKGGGSSFECSDYEGMDADMQAFIQQEKDKSYEEGSKETTEAIIKMIRYAKEPYREGRGITLE